MTHSVLILGARGKIGVHSAQAFSKAGWEVRSYQRGTDMVAAAAGVDVIINGLNPPNYHDWKTTIPAITAQVIAAGTASGATVILPGNVYNFGDTPGIWDETTPHRPMTRKGRIRVEMEQTYRDAGVRTIVLRAGNFIDPNRDGDLLSMVMLKGVGRGKLTRMGDMDVMQTYAFLPDWARAAEKLASVRDRLARFEDVPFPGHAVTTRTLKDAVEGIIGRPLKVSLFPWWIMRLLSPVWELARELTEMRYLNETSHQLGRARFDALLPGFSATDLETALRRVVQPDIHPDQPVRTGQATVAAE